MTTIVLPRLPRGLEHMGVFVCTLPPPPPRLGHGQNVVRREAVMGDPAMVRELCPRCGIARRDLTPMDRQGLVATAPQDIVEVARHLHCRDAAMAVACFLLGDRVARLPKRSALREGGMGVGVTRNDAVAAMRHSQRTKGLVAGESIPQ
jgi:hypothetical protein